jgi:opacity protein-like surface antigen
MKQRRFGFASLVAVSLTAAFYGASANAEGFYFGVDLGSASFDTSKADLDKSVLTPYVKGLQAGGLTVTSAPSSLDDNDNAWAANVGYRFNSYVAAEFGYVNLGESLYRAQVTSTNGVNTFVDVPSVRLTASGPTAALLGVFPVGPFDIYGKAGIFFSKTKSRLKLEIQGEDTVSSELKADSQDFFYGIGANWNFSENYAVRLQYQKFLKVGDNDHTGESDVDFISVGILFR